MAPRMRDVPKHLALSGRVAHLLDEPERQTRELRVLREPSTSLEERLPGRFEVFGGLAVHARRA